MFIKETLADPGKVRPGQGAGAIHVHPNGRFVYLTNRNAGLVDFNGGKVSNGGENNVAVFSIDERSGEPTPIQSIDGLGNHLRTFGIDPQARLLIAATIGPLPVRDGDAVKLHGAGIFIYRVGIDGRLTFARKCDVASEGRTRFWSGMVTLG